MTKELSKTKLNKILKKYRQKLEDHDKEWKSICAKAMSKFRNQDPESKDIIIAGPTLAQHERHNSKGFQLFKEMMAELEPYDVFPKKEK